MNNSKSNKVSFVNFVEDPTKNKVKKNNKKYDNIIDKNIEYYPLMRKWNLGYINGKNMPKQNCSSDFFSKSLDTIGIIEDVLTMWSYLNNIDIELLGVNSCLYLFENGILPMWEDINNIEGFIYKSYIHGKYINNIFLELSLRTLGETFLNSFSENKIGKINGIYIKKSYKTYEIQIWANKYCIDISSILYNITNNEWKCINIH